jgi:hypothetical protein
MGAETLGHEEAKDGLAIQRAILSLIRAHGGNDPSAPAQASDWQMAVRPEPAAGEISDTPETIINLLCAIQSSDIGARLRGEERGANPQDQRAVFDEQALREALQGTELAARLRAEAGQGNGSRFPLEFDPQGLLQTIQGTETAALLERAVSESKRQAEVLASAELAAPVADRTAHDLPASSLPADEPSHLESVLDAASEPALDGPPAADEPGAVQTAEALLAANNEVSDQSLIESEPAKDATTAPERIETFDVPSLASGGAEPEMPFATTSSESAAVAPAAGTADEISMPNVPANAKSARIARRLNRRVMRKRMSAPLANPEVPAIPQPQLPSPSSATTGTSETLIPVRGTGPSEEIPISVAPCVPAPAEFESATVPVQPIEPTAEIARISSLPAEALPEIATPIRGSDTPAPSEAGSLSAPPPPDSLAADSSAVSSSYPSAEEKEAALPSAADPSRDRSVDVPRLDHLRGDLFRAAEADRDRRRRLQVGRLAAKAGAKVNNGLASTAGLTSECLDRAEMQLESWFLKWFEPPDPRHHSRVDEPPLVAYHWIVDSPQALKVANISSGGLYLLTEDRWSEGNIVSMTLQRTDREKGSPESWIAVDFLVMRWCKDGIAGAFLPHRPGLSDAVAGRAKNCADAKTLERFVKELNRR